MASRNPITNDEIKSRVYSEDARLRHAVIFEKHTAQEWLDLFAVKIVIYDPDGWRLDDGVTIETPLKFKDFYHRLIESTCLNQDTDSWKKLERFL